MGADWVLVRRLHVRDGRGQNFSNFFWCGAGLNFAGAMGGSGQIFQPVQESSMHRCRSRHIFWGAKAFIPNFPKIARKSFVQRTLTKKTGDIFEGHTFVRFRRFQAVSILPSEARTMLEIFCH